MLSLNTAYGHLFCPFCIEHYIFLSHSKGFFIWYFNHVHLYYESCTQLRHCNEALLFSQGCSPVVCAADYVGMCSHWALALSLRLTQQHRCSAPQHSADGCQETKETDISELLLSYGNNVHL